MIEQLNFRDIVSDDNDFEVRIIKHPKRRRPRNMHIHHDFSELLIISGGSGKHIIEGKSYPLKYGDVFVIKGDIPHQIENSGDLELYAVCYDQNNFPIPVEELRKTNGFQCLFILEPFYREKYQFKSKLHLDTNKMAIAKELLDNMIKEIKWKLTGYKSIIKAFFTQLVFLLSREYENSDNLPSREIFTMANAVTYIEKNYLEQIKLKDIVSRSFISERHFLRLFRQHYKTSPIDYIIHLRIEHACNLMKNKKLTISEVAFESGFSDSNYFTRKFKQIKEMSPKQYIKKV